MSTPGPLRGLNTELANSGDGLRRRCSSLYDETLAVLIRLFLLLPSSAFRGPAPSGNNNHSRGGSGKSGSIYSIQQQQWTEIKRPVDFCVRWVDFVVGTSCNTKSHDYDYDAASS